MKTYDETCWRRIESAHAHLAGDRRRRLHRLAPRRAAARARPARGRPGQLLHRQAREPGAVKDAVGEAAWKSSASSRATSARSTTCQRGLPTASSWCCTRRRSAACRARSTTRSPRTTTTSTASSTCWSRRATPACARLVYASSSAVYGDHPGLPKVEARIGRPLSPYGLTKHMNELYAGVFAACYGFESIGLRYFNVFGPRQDPDGAYAAVIPAWIGALLRGQTAYINGDGEHRARLLLRRQRGAGQPARRDHRGRRGAQPGLQRRARRADLAHRAVRDDPRRCSRRACRTCSTVRAGAPRAAPRRPALLARRHRQGASACSATAPTHRIAQGLESTIDWYAANLDRRRPQEKVVNA